MTRKNYKVLLPQLAKSLKSDGTLSLFHLLKKNNIPIASSCNGEAVCGKCQVQVTRGINSLPRPNKDEQRLRKNDHLSSDVRISCQLHVRSDIEIKTDYW